jgi:PKD repeat protein
MIASGLAGSWSRDLSVPALPGHGSTGASLPSTAATGHSSLSARPHTSAYQNWTQYASGNLPPIYGAATSEFPVNSLYNATLFGGDEVPSPGATPVPQNTTYVYNDTLGWVAVPAAGPAPPAIVNASLAYDPSQGDYVLFGGQSASGTLLNGTWLLWLNDSYLGWTAYWHFDSLTVAPSPRSNFGMSYTSGIGGIVLFGGEGAGSAVFGDTWTWGQGGGGEGWVQLSLPQSPLPSAGVSFAQTSTGGVILFGGWNAGGIPLAETWEFGPFGNWTNHSAASAAPPARWGAEFAWSGALNTMVLFSGCGSVAGGCTSLLDDTWLLTQGYQWIPVVTASAPPARVDGGMVTTDGGGGCCGGATIALLAGGFGSTAYGDTWAFPSGGLAAPTVNIGSNYGGVTFAPDTVTFSSNVMGPMPPYSLNWSFGDGSYSTLADPVHTYTQVGVYSPWLSACDVLGCWSSNTLYIELTSTGEPLVGGANVTTHNLTVGQIDLLKANVTGGTPGYSYNWSVDYQASNASYQSHAQNFSCQFNLTGWWLVTLTVFDHGGQSLSNTTWVYVRSTIAPLTLQLTESPTSGTAPASVLFSASVSGGDGSGWLPYLYTFTWGDGTNLSFWGNSSDSITHTYLAAGTYQGWLEVQDHALSAVSTSFTIDVQPAPGGPSLSLTAAPSSGSAPLAVSFDGSIQGGVAPYRYDFWAYAGTNFATGNAVGSSISVSYTYSEAGTYTAELQIFDSLGQAAAAFATISVSGGASSPLQLSVVWGNTSGPAPLNATLSGQASGGAGFYYWNFTWGDGSRGSDCLEQVECVESHWYLAPGVYIATVTLSDSFGQSTSQNVSIDVQTANETPLQVFYHVEPTSGYAPLTVELTASATGSEGPYSFSWSIVNSQGETLGSSGGRAVNFTIDQSGDYTAVLSVRTPDAGASEFVPIQVWAAAHTLPSQPAHTASAPSAGEIIDIGVGLLVVVSLVVAMVAWQRLGRPRRLRPVGGGQFADASGAPGTPSGPAAGPRTFGTGGEGSGLGLDPYSAYRFPPGGPRSPPMASSTSRGQPPLSGSDESGLDDMAFSGML